MAETSRWLGAILAVAFIVRVVAAVYVQRRLDADPNPNRLCLIEGDASGYWELAKAIVQGQDYAVYDPPRRVLRMPGFPLILAAGMKTFGERPLPIRILLAAIGTAGCGFLYLLGAELFDRRVGLLGAALAAISPPMALFSVLLLSEIPFATAVTGSLWLLAQVVRGNASDKPANATLIALAAGIGVGVATLIRPTWLLVGPGFCLVLLALARSRLRAAAQSIALLLAVAVALVPWTIRNYQVTGHIVPTTLWVGASLYDGLHAGATGASDMRFVEADGIYSTRSEYEADQYYRRAAWSFVRANPGRSLELAFIKLGRFWNPLPNAEQFGGWFIGLALAGTFIPTILLAAVGIRKFRVDVWRWLIPWSPILYFSAIHTVFVGSIRYRLPAEGPLLVLAAAALMQWWSAMAIPPRPGKGVTLP